MKLPIAQLANLSPTAKRALLTQLLRNKVGKTLMNVDGLAMSVAMLTGETTLDASVAPGSAPFDLVDEPRQIFLTGATGFLGAFLLANLLDKTTADVHCLVRAATPEEARARLRQTLTSYSLWRDDRAARIVPVPGDLGTPGLGLSPRLAQTLASTVDAIYHSGASVNWIYPYERLKPANVLGTHELLRLATRVRVKPVHFVSSLGVFPLIGSHDVAVIREDDTLDHNGSLYGGYLHSKWVADKLVMAAQSRGLPISIYRPGLITGHTETGAWNTSDVVSRMLKSWIELKGAPTFDYDETDMTPVNYIADAIVHLSGRKDSLGRVFHIANPRRVQLGKVADWMRDFGYPLRKVPYESWMAELLTRSGSSREDFVSSLVPLFSLSISGAGSTVMKSLPVFDCRNTLAGLEGSSISCSPIDNRVLEHYFSHFISRGFVDPPPTGAARLGAPSPPAHGTSGAAAVPRRKLA